MSPVHGPNLKIKRLRNRYVFKLIVDKDGNPVAYDIFFNAQWLGSRGTKYVASYFRHRSKRIKERDPDMGGGV